MKLHTRVARMFGYELTHARKHPSLRAHLLNVIQRYGIDRVLDVGANTGQFASGLRKDGFKGEIHSFEPAAAPFAKLEALSSRDAKWHAHNLALGASAHEATLNVADATDLSSFLEPTQYGNERYQAIQATAQQVVQVRRLDEMWGELSKTPGKTLLKLDTQGFDLQVIEGAKACLPDVTALLSELSVIPLYEGMPHYLDALKRYEDEGFAVTGIYPECRSRDSMTVIEMNCVMVRAS